MTSKISIENLEKHGWSKNYTKYLNEFFKKIDIENHPYYKDFLDQIIASSSDQYLVGFYDVGFFDGYITEYAKYEFKDLQNGSFDEKNGFYKTNDGKFILEIQA